MKLEDFWTKVEKTQTCWLWIGSRSAEGYGNLRLPGNKVRYAHRISYQLTKGEIPQGLVIDHLCRVRNCVNPDHLEAVTFGENVRRGAQAYGLHKRTCPNGHDVTDSANVRITNRGHKRCRACDAVYRKPRKERWGA